MKAAKEMDVALDMIERYSVTYWYCHSETWFDNDEELPDKTECWRCQEIINGDL